MRVAPLPGEEAARRRQHIPEVWLALCVSGLVCLLKNNPPGLEDLWFLLCLYMELTVWVLAQVALGLAGVGGTHGCQAQLLPMADPHRGGFSWALRSAFGCSACWHPHCAHGLLSGAVGRTTDGCRVGEPWAAPSCPQPVLSPSLGPTCTTGMRALLHHSTVTSCSKACEGTGSDLKMESYPIYHHHTHADVRAAWRCTRKATGTVAGEDDKLPATTTSFATAQEAELSCSCPRLSPHGRTWLSWPSDRGEAPGCMSLFAEPSACCWHPRSLAAPLRQVWGSEPAWHSWLCQECAECVGT